MYCIYIMFKIKGNKLGYTSDRAGKSGKSDVGKHHLILCTSGC